MGSFSNVVGGNEEFEIEVSGKYISNDDESMIRMALNGTGIIQHLDLQSLNISMRASYSRFLRIGPFSFPGFYIYVSSRVRIAL